MNFENRFVAFIDILGFREIVKEKTEVARVMNIIQSAIQTAGVDQESHKIFPKDELKLTALSDAIVISILIGSDKYEAFKSLRYLLSAVEKIQYKCAISDIWMRGGVSWGELHHEENVVGEGLVRAYELEQNAIFPRVLIDPALIPDFFSLQRGPQNRRELISEINQKYNRPEYSGKFIFDKQELVNGFSGCFQDDVPLFVHYFNSVYDEATPENDRISIAKALKKRLYCAASPQIYAKYRWVVDYLSVIPPIGTDMESGLLGEVTAL